MKNPSMAKLVKAAGDNRAAAKMKTESAAKMKKSPMEKELKGKQHNLPEELKSKIEAAPSKMKKAATKMKKDSAVKRAGYYEYDVDGNKKQITTDEYNKKRADLDSGKGETTGGTTTAGRASDKGKPGHIVADMSHGYDEINKKAKEGQPAYVEAKNSPEFKKSAEEGNKGRGQRGTHVKTTRYAADAKNQRDFDKNKKAKAEGGDSAAPFLGKKSHSEKMDRIAGKNQKKIDRITGKAKEDRKAKREQNKITRAGERGQAKDDRKRLAEARKAGRAAASQARATERLDRKSARAQGREDRAIARADRKIAKQEAKKQKAYDKNYKTMSKATNKYNA